MYILRTILIQTVFTCTLSASFLAHSLTLDQVYDDGEIICGVTTGEPGFSSPNTKNEWQGIEVDLCRALAITIFDSADSVRYVPLIASERINAVASGIVHVLAAKTHWNWTTGADFNLTMIGPYFRDGQGFLVHNEKNIRSAWGLQNVTTCTVAGGIEEEQLRRFLKQLRSYISLSLFENLESTVSSFEEGECDVVSAEITSLNILRRKLENPESTSILPQLISQKPIGIIVHAEDSQWPQLVQLVFSALVRAEELNVTSFNIEKAREIGTIQQQEFIAFGENEKFDAFSSDNWIYQVILTLGNYGEIFQRHLGEDTLADLPRGVNKSWRRGGLTIQSPLF